MRVAATWRSLALAVTVAAALSADTLILRDGTQHQGAFVSANGRDIWFNVDGEGRESFRMDEVQSILFGDSSPSFGSSDRQRNPGGVFRGYESAQHRDNDAIERKYFEMGGPDGFAGGSIAPEQPTADGRGRYREFQNVTVYWTSETGAHEVHGAIREEYRRLGGPQGRLGYPTSDEEPSGVGRVSHFENGAIYWSEDDGTRVTYMSR